MTRNINAFFNKKKEESYRSGAGILIISPVIQVPIVGKSYIRHEDFLLLLRPPPSGSYYPPWILKRAGLESSGRRLISSIGKTKRIAFFFCQKKITK